MGEPWPWSRVYRCVAKLRSCRLKVLGDCVLNHRCASHQDAQGKWNQYGGRLDWDARAIVRDDANFGGKGGDHLRLLAALENPPVDCHDPV